MSWRDIQSSTPIDKIDKIDKMSHPAIHIVDIVDIVEREESSKNLQKEPANFFSSVVKPGNNAAAALPEMKVVWKNPFPKGTPEARAESLRVIEAARRGEPIPLYYETSPFTEEIRGLT